MTPPETPACNPDAPASFAAPLGSQELLEKVWKHMQGYNIDGSWLGPDQYQDSQDACLRNWNELHRLVAEYFANTELRHGGDNSQA